jgi:hypothetical protein
MASSFDHSSSSGSVKLSVMEDPKSPSWKGTCFTLDLTNMRNLLRIFYFVLYHALILHNRAEIRSELLQDVPMLG